MGNGEGVGYTVKDASLGVDVYVVLFTGGKGKDGKVEVVVTFDWFWKGGEVLDEEGSFGFFFVFGLEDGKGRVYGKHWSLWGLRLE